MNNFSVIRKHEQIQLEKYTNTVRKGLLYSPGILWATSDLSSTIKVEVRQTNKQTTNTTLSLLLTSLYYLTMKTAVFAFFGLVATALSAKVDIETLKGVMAHGHGEVTSAAAADGHSGAASGAVDGHGHVLGMAQPGGALSGALSSPYL